jgi:hypothetical protein
VACASSGNCVAGGRYTDESNHTQALVISETSGTWGNAEELPGSATVNAGGVAYVQSVSCASASNCAVGGLYTDSSHHAQALVASETTGTWGDAEEVPGTATLNAGGDALVYSMSCASAGDCAAVGQYFDSHDHIEAFVVSSGNVTTPSISTFTPSSGPVGTVVTVKGTNLADATAVTFNGVAATDVKKDTPTKIKVVVPAGATTGRIEVTTSLGSAMSSSTFQVT